MRRPGNLIFSGRLGARAANLAAFSQQSSGWEGETKRTSHPKRTRKGEGEAVGEWNGKR